MKELGPLHYFLSIEVHHTHHGLCLSQSKYASDLISRALMMSCKSISTPVGVESMIDKGDTTSHPDATQYRSIVGALQYLTITRPDLCSKYSLSVHAQSHDLRNVNGTLNLGLCILAHSSLDLYAFSIVDWAGCHTRSILDFAPFLDPTASLGVQKNNIQQHVPALRQNIVQWHLQLLS